MTAYTGNSPIYFGRGAKAPPAWMSSMALNEWHPIQGNGWTTAGTGGATVDPYCGWAWCKPLDMIVSAAAGGHRDSADNRVVGVKLLDDRPFWDLLCAPSPAEAIILDVGYYGDGKPSSRHVYQMAQFVAALNRVMFLGCRFSYSSAGHTELFTDGFDLTTNQWDPAGTWPNTPGMDGSGIVDGDGNAWGSSCGVKFTAATGKYTTPNITGSVARTIRHPWAWDSKHKLMVGICFGDGEGGTVLIGDAVSPSSLIRRVITFNPSAGLDAFLAEAPMYAGLDYDEENDWFMSYAGTAAGAKTYKLTLHDDLTCDVALFPFGPNSTALPLSPQGGGINNRLSYSKTLKGFVCLPNQNSPLYFMKTA